jgi:hypothetical protein
LRHSLDLDAALDTMRDLLRRRCQNGERRRRFAA